MPPLSFRVRAAAPSDADAMHAMVVELALHEGESAATVECTPDSLRAQLAETVRPPFEAVILEAVVAAAGGEVRVEVAGMAMFFHNYSTWRGKKGLYLEDLFVREHFRGSGGGKRLLAHLAAIAEERGCPRFEWIVLDTLAKSRAFYESLGAVPNTGWTIHRLDGPALAELARLGRSAAIVP